MELKIVEKKMLITKKLIRVSITLLFVLMTFLTFWLFSNSTKLPFDVVRETSYAGTIISFGWFHCFINTFATIFSVILFIMTFFNIVSRFDKHTDIPFKSEIGKEIKYKWYKLV